MKLKIARIVILLRQGKNVKFIIKKNYKELICFFEKLLVNDFDCLENKNIEMVNNELIKIIFKKIQKEKKLDLSELNIFLYTLYFDAIKFLNLDSKKIKMRCIKPNGKNLNDDCGGVHSHRKDKHYVYYNKELLDKICDKTLIKGRFYFMNMIVHELIHVKQVKDLANEDISLNSYIISLEELVGEYEKYYEDNYEFTKIEIDAMVRSFENVIRFLYKHKLLNKDVKNEVYQILFDYSNKMDSNFINHKIKYNGEDIKTGSYLLLETSRLLSSNNEFFKKYPLLTFSHYKDGTLKDYNRLLLERKALLEWLAKENVNNYEEAKFEIEGIYNYLFEIYSQDNTNLNVVNYNKKGLNLSK